MHSPAERWAIRDRLVRIEQLVAACKAHGGRAAAEDDPMLAHLVVPRGDNMVDDEVFYVFGPRRAPQFLGQQSPGPDGDHPLR